MGASLDTLSKCPLCDENTLKPVVLKCNHRFCQRCIGDLWSVTPKGPFRCPEWRCKTEYKTPPFDSSQWRTPISSRSSRPSTSTGSSKNDVQDTTLGKLSLSNRLLGKRKASSTGVEEAPDRKKKSNGTEDTTIAADETLYATCIDITGRDVSQQSERVKRTPSCPSGSASHQSGDVPEDPPTQKVQVESEEFIMLEDSESSDEADVCDGLSVETPRKNDAHGSSSPVTEQGVTSSNAATPASSSKIVLLPRPDNKPNNTPVPCHYCPKIHNQRAVKTCLVCGASMCAEHLRPHMESPVFLNHPLISPVEDISLWRCQEHHDINRIYCRQCCVCVCTVCTMIGSHRGHVCISIRDAEMELRGTLKDEIKQLQMAEKQVKDQTAEFSEKKEAFTKALSTSRAGVQQQYRSIREALDQEEEIALRCVTKEEGRVLGGLEKKLDSLKNSLQDIQRGLQTLETLADNSRGSQLHDQAFIMEYSKVAQLASEVGSCADRFETPEELDEGRLKGLQMWTEKRLDSVVVTKDMDLYRLIYGTIPTLDPNTAHPKLKLSDDSKVVTYSEVQVYHTDQEARFTSFPQVLGSQALETGRWYWEVSVSMDDGRWKVGVCTGQMERKGQKDSSRLGFNSQSWCVAYERRKVEALHNKVSEPLDADKLQKVGVLLDFDEGVLSFYNVAPGGSTTLMHSFKHSFTEPLYPALSVSKTQLAICDLFHM
ncbi:tripartite motif-containing protein 14 [Neosynchiropus ocellatus]